MMKPNLSSTTTQVSGVTGSGQNQTAPFNTPAGMVSAAAGMPAQTMTAGVSANPHHFQQTSANQNGMSGHVTAGQPMGKELTTAETKEEMISNLANTKEKTPMCLINELARFNKVTHQYTLVDEQGPAHKKTFYVKLQLGDGEEYSASGASIKKAQHSAADSALTQTKYRHPPPKPKMPYMNNGELDCKYTKYRHPPPKPKMPYMNNGELDCDDASSITPTVELNALAMKRGEPAIYRNIENRSAHPMFYPHNYDFRGMYNQRYHYMRPPRVVYVSLKVGSREFIGEGNSRQMARHNAAKKALDILQALPMPDGVSVLPGGTDVQTEITDDMMDDSKSEISIVHEIALRHNLAVSFEVLRESGPPHMKTFVTVCIVGNYMMEAEGNSKKVSKKRAADMMLKQLKQSLPALPMNLPRLKPKPAVNKKKNRNLIKMQKADPTYGVGINPISRLIQIQQAQKKKEPLYTLLAERGLPRRREFIMQVQVDEETCTGVGPNKKLAKRHAAEAMLQLLGYNKPSPQPAKPAIKMQGDNSPGDKKVTFSDNAEESGNVVNGQGGRQMVPGLIVLPEGNRNSYAHLKGMQNQFNVSGLMKATHNFGMRPEMKLREVCGRHNVDVKFDEFAGSNNPNEYLSRVMVASNPQHTLHGSGPTPEASRDCAAMSALKILTEMGLVKDDFGMSASGDNTSQIKG